MSREADSAQRILAKAGEPVIVMSALEQVQTFDPITGDPITQAERFEYLAKGYLGRYRLADVDGSNVMSTDGRLILPQMPVRPQRGWYVKAGTAPMDDWYEYFYNMFSSDVARIMDVMPIRKAGLDIIYICQLRAN